MNLKKFLIILIIVIVTIIVAFSIDKHKRSKREDVKIPILLYHNFVTTVPDEDPDNFNYINTPKSFEENIKVILESGYTIISMQELNDANNLKSDLPSKPILITFDDGYYSNYEYIYPILKKYNVKASIFIVTENVGKQIDGIQYLGWEECLEMQESGLVEIFSHSKSHVFYDKLPDRQIRDDVIESYKKVYDIGINNFKNFNKDYIKRINIPCEMTGKEIIDEIESEN